MWYVTYSDIGSHYGRLVQPIPNRPISIAKEDPSEALGKERIVLASSDGFLYSMLRANGTLNWTSVLITSDIREPRPTGIYPTYRGDLVVTGLTEGRGFIMSVDREMGAILGNVSTGSLRAFTFPTPIIGRPDYVSTSRNYIFSTEAGTIFILEESLELKASFTVLSGSATSAGFIGNIINNIGTTQGNYFSVMTRQGTVYIQTVSGTYVAPLPPGTYESGNRYLLGTDVFGGDLWTQLIYATRTELVVGLVAAVISAVLGTLVGLIAGYYGGWIDVVLMRLTDIFLTLPILVIALLLAAVLGPSIGNIILIIAIFSWAGVARVIRAQTLSLKNRSFIDAARVSGATNRSIIIRHLGPNVLPLTFLYMVFTISGAIITEAILAFLGMGDPTAVTWGMMLQFLQISGNTLSAPWWLLPPGICITLLSLSFYMIGRAFDEVVNPRLRAR
jgi:peptide/nickel transport system permease protein